VSSSRRDGSNWLRVNSGLGVTEVPDPNDPANGFGPEAIFMPTLANRQRDKLKLLVDWQPLEVMSLQFSAEAGRDSYTTPSSQGLRNADMNLFNADWDLAISTNWSVNGYVSRGNQSYLQSRPAGYIRLTRIPAPTPDRA
jgi:Putative outer membrane beta-barrel porin, MtrB/PioB